MPLPAEVAVIVPTFNEAGNVALLAAAVEGALDGFRWEIVFVDDDSPDGTAARARAMAQRDPRIRVVHRYRRRGLASACVEGFLATSAPLLAVMDGDLQHDEAILPLMLQHLRHSDVDLVVGSRYVAGGGTGGWAGRRLAMSRFATRLATRITGTALCDPMSGFFMIRRDAFMAALPHLSTVGFKILLDLAASSPTPLRIAEVPYTFRARRSGESKLGLAILWEYGQLLLDKAMGHIIPVRFLSFAAVGGSGVVVHFLVLAAALQALSGEAIGLEPARAFAAAQTVATIIAATSNFLLNNALTYRDQQLKGRRLLWGWCSFNLVCGVGFTANVGIAKWLYEQHTALVVSALAGVAVTTVWNYAMSSLFTWRKRV